MTKHSLKYLLEWAKKNEVLYESVEDGTVLVYVKKYGHYHTAIECDSLYKALEKAHKAWRDKK